MTNCASSRMKMTGSEADISRFIETCCTVDPKASTFRIALEKAIPPPPDLLDPNGNVNSSAPGWAFLNWGAGWLDYQKVEHRNAGFLEITYGSPVGPPFVFNRVLAERFPDIEIEIACYERGNDYGYRFKAHRGVVDARESGADEALIREVEGPDAEDVPSQEEIEAFRAGAPARLLALKQAAAA